MPWAPEAVEEPACPQNLSRPIAFVKAIVSGLGPHQAGGPSLTLLSPVDRTSELPALGLGDIMIQQFVRSHFQMYYAGSGGFVTQLL